MGNKNPRCKSENCNKKINDIAFKNYCSLHKCVRLNCQNSQYDNSPYCVCHKCANFLCSGEAIIAGRCQMCQMFL